MLCFSEWVMAELEVCSVARAPCSSSYLFHLKKNKIRFEAVQNIKLKQAEADLV